MSPQSSHPHGGGWQLPSLLHFTDAETEVRAGTETCMGLPADQESPGWGVGGLKPRQQLPSLCSLPPGQIYANRTRNPASHLLASPRDFHISAQLTLNKVLGSSHFKDKEMMAQRGQVVCLRAQRGQKGHEGSWLLRPMPKRWLTQRGPYRADQATGSHCSIATVCCPSEQLLNVPSPVPAQPLASLGPH